MDLSLTWEQQQLKETLDRLMGGKAWDWRALWQQLNELGVLDLPKAGGTSVDTMIVMESLGRAAAPTPYIASVVLAGEVIETDRLAILAHHERAARFDLARVDTTATKRGDSWVLNGRKDIVPWADVAELLVVSARADDGIALFRVDPKANGVSLRPYPTVDGHRAADVTLEGVVIGDRLPGGVAEIERAVDRATAAAVAEQLGAMSALYEMTLGYTRQRRQFGQTIGSFQVVQHRLVDMFVSVELARSMAALAALAADRVDPAARARDVSAAKAQVARASRFVAQQAVQLHGAIGMTDEYPAGRYFKRLTVLETMFGDADYHRRRFAAL